MMKNLHAFIAESNRIEGIHRKPTAQEYVAHDDFLQKREITIPDLERLVEACTGRANILRVRKGMNVAVGNHAPPPGGMGIMYRLDDLLKEVNGGVKNEAAAFAVHVRYELLHPFMDGNGRSGRALWAWMMLMGGSDVPLGFLHEFYYQTLNMARRAA